MQTDQLNDIQFSPDEIKKLILKCMEIEPAPDADTYDEAMLKAAKHQNDNPFWIAAAMARLDALLKIIGLSQHRFPAFMIESRDDGYFIHDALFAAAASLPILFKSVSPSFNEEEFLAFVFDYTDKEKQSDGLIT